MVGAALLLAILIVGAAVIVVFRPFASPSLFSVKKFESVQPGMTEETVISILGEPRKRIADVNSGELAWRYEEPVLTIVPDPLYYIFMKDGVVTRTLVDDY